VHVSAPNRPLTVDRYLPQRWERLVGRFTLRSLLLTTAAVSVGFALLRVSVPAGVLYLLLVVPSFARTRRLLADRSERGLATGSRGTVAIFLHSIFVVLMTTVLGFASLAAGCVVSIMLGTLIFGGASIVGPVLSMVGCLASMFLAAGAATQLANHYWLDDPLRIENRI